MKLNLICSCFAAMCAAFVVSSCSSDDEGTTTVNVRNVYTTGCKTEGQPSQAGSATTRSPFGAEYVEYKSKTDGYVYINHANVSYNCCSEEIDVTLTVTGNRISVVEKETDTSCNCLCPFDVSYEVGPLKAGKYILVINSHNTLHEINFTYPSDGRVEL